MDNFSDSDGATTGQCGPCGADLPLGSTASYCDACMPAHLRPGCDDCGAALRYEAPFTSTLCPSCAGMVAPPDCTCGDCRSLGCDPDCARPGCAS